MSTEIATFNSLFTSAWDQYKKRALPLIAVMLISTVAVGSLMLGLALCAILGGAVLTHFTDERTATYLVIALVFVLLLGVFILGFWSYAALFALVINEDLGIIEAFQTGWTWLWPMAWVLTLAPTIVLTGFLLGILPGILFTVWFTFSVFVLLEEDRRGMDALLVSMAYVRGHWWNTFGKLLFLWLISVAASLIPFIGQLFSLLFTPFALLFLLAMYRNLKESHGGAEVEGNTSTRIFFWVLTLLGLGLSLAALGAGLYALLTGEGQWQHLPDAMHGKWL